MFRMLLMATAVLANLAQLGLAAPRLELTMAPAQSGFVLGEPVAVVIRLSNTGDQPVTVARHLRPEYANVRFVVAKDNGIGRVYAPWGIKEPKEPFAVLAPGESLVEVADLFYDARGWVFTEAGAWTIDAVYAGTVPAKRLQLTIVSPRNNAERAAAETLLASPDAGRFLLLRGGDHLPIGMSVLDQITREEPTTPHAVAANLALGINGDCPVACSPGQYGPSGLCSRVSGGRRLPGRPGRKSTPRSLGRQSGRFRASEPRNGRSHGVPLLVDFSQQGLVFRWSRRSTWKKRLRLFAINNLGFVTKDDPEPFIEHNESGVTHRAYRYAIRYATPYFFILQVHLLSSAVHLLVPGAHTPCPPIWKQSLVPSQVHTPELQS